MSEREYFAGEVRAAYERLENDLTRASFEALEMGLPLPDILSILMRAPGLQSGPDGR